MRAEAAGGTEGPPGALMVREGRENSSSVMSAEGQNYKDKESLTEHQKTQEVAPSSPSHSDTHPKSVSRPVWPRHPRNQIIQA